MFGVAVVLEDFFGARRRREDECVWLRLSTTNSHGTVSPSPQHRLVSRSGSYILTFSQSLPTTPVTTIAAASQPTICPCPCAYSNKAPDGKCMCNVEPLDQMVMQIALLQKRTGWGVLDPLVL